MTKKDGLQKDSLTQVNIKNRLIIQKELSDLQLFRNEDIDEEVILLWVLEFENLGMSLDKIKERIQKARYVENYNKTKFSQFIDPAIDELIPANLVYKKANEIVESQNQSVNNLSKILFEKRFMNLSREEVSTLKYILNLNEDVSNSIPVLKDKLKTELELLKELDKVYSGKKEILEKMETEITDSIKKALQESKKEIPEYISDVFRLKIDKIITDKIKSLTN